MEKFLFVGLGNPGEKYENTRHNIGFEVLDFFSKKINLNLNPIDLVAYQVFQLKEEKYFF